MPPASHGARETGGAGRQHRAGEIGQDDVGCQARLVTEVGLAEFDCRRDCRSAPRCRGRSRARQDRRRWRRRRPPRGAPPPAPGRRTRCRRPARGSRARSRRWSASRQSRVVAWCPLPKPIAGSMMMVATSGSIARRAGVPWRGDREAPDPDGAQRRLASPCPVLVVDVDGTEAEGSRAVGRVQERERRRPLVVAPEEDVPGLARLFGDGDDVQAVEVGQDAVLQRQRSWRAGGTRSGEDDLDRRPGRHQLKRSFTRSNTPRSSSSASRRRASVFSAGSTLASCSNAARCSLVSFFGVRGCTIT